MRQMRYVAMTLLLVLEGDTDWTTVQDELVCSADAYEPSQVITQT